MSEIYNLKLHEMVEGGKGGVSYQTMRVPGGWIYRFFQLRQESGGDGQWIENYVADSVFVPLNSEFKEE